MAKIILKSSPAVVMKNSTFTVKPAEKEWDWDPTTHEVYKNFIWQEVQTIQISDQKEIYKIWWKLWSFDNVPFGTPWRLVISFEPIDIK